MKYHAYILTFLLFLLIVPLSCKRETVSVQAAGEQEQPQKKKPVNPWGKWIPDETPYVPVSELYKAEELPSCVREIAGGAYEADLDTYLHQSGELLSFTGDELSDRLIMAYDETYKGMSYCFLNTDGTLGFYSGADSTRMTNRVLSVSAGDGSARCEFVQSTPDKSSMMVLLFTGDGSVRSVFFPRVRPSFAEIAYGDGHFFWSNNEGAVDTTLRYVYVHPEQKQGKHLAVTSGRVVSPLHRLGEPDVARDSYGPGCEVFVYGRSPEPVRYEGELSYWFRTANGWLPASSLYLQQGIFDELPVLES